MDRAQVGNGPHRMKSGSIIGFDGRVAEITSGFGAPDSRIFVPYFNLVAVCVHVKPNLCSQVYGFVPRIVQAGMDLPDSFDQTVFG